MTRPAPPPNQPAWRRDLAAAAGILALALVGYANSFHGAFVFDDVQSITFNTAIRGLGAFFDGGYRIRPNRAVGYLTLAANYQLGGLEVTGYHVVNFCIHVLNALLVYAIVNLTIRTPRLRVSSLAGSPRAAAFVAAALFVAHPIQTQGVTYVVQRLTSLATTFYLLSAVLYARWRLRLPETRSRAGNVLGYLPIVVSALLAMKTKEIAFTLPIAVAAWELFFFDGPPAKRLGFLAPLLATLVVIPLTLVNVGKPVGEVLSDVSTVTKVQTGISRLDYFRTELAVIATYLRLLLLPVGQNVDHDYPHQHSFLEPRVLWAMVVIGALAALALYLLRASSSSRRALDPGVRLVAFGILWFFLALSVESSLIPIVDVIFEHRAYLPSVGFFVAVAAAVALLAGRLRSADPARAVVWIGAAASLVLALATLNRNRVWADDLSLWSDSALKSPHKSRPQNNVAAALIDRSRLREAEPYAMAAIRFDPGNAEAYYNLGRIYLEEERYDESLALFRDAVRLRHDYADAYANMAGALNRLSRCEETVRMLEGVSALVRDNPPAQFNLGVAYSALGMREAAERQAATLRKLSPHLALQLEQFMARR